LTRNFSLTHVKLKTIYLFNTISHSIMHLSINYLIFLFNPIAVIEHVRDGCTVRAFLLPDFYHVTVMITGIKAS